MCHLILLVPLFALPVFWLWPLAYALPVYLVTLILSAWVYYYAAAMMRRQVVVGSEALRHSRGEVVSTNDGRLCVRVHGELWNAEASEPLRAGDRVEILDVVGVTLKVMAVSGSEWLVNDRTTAGK